MRRLSAVSGWLLLGLQYRSRVSVSASSVGCEMGREGWRALRPRVTRRSSRSGHLAPGTETVGKCLLN